MEVVLRVDGDTRPKKSRNEREFFHISEAGFPPRTPVIDNEVVVFIYNNVQIMSPLMLHHACRGSFMINGFRRHASATWKSNYEVALSGCPL